MKQVSLYFNSENIDLYEYVFHTSKQERLSLNTFIMKAIKDHKDLNAK